MKLLYFCQKGGQRNGRNEQYGNDRNHQPDN